MLELQNVSKRYGSMHALHPLTLAFPRGQTTVLLGSSGCGKSTLLRLLNGLVRPDTGKVLFDGRELDDTTLPEARRRMGYALQGGGLFPHLTAANNVTLMARHLQWPQERIVERLQNLCELTRLSASLMQRYPAELSGGQRQRVSLMRALMLEPDVLLLDEPLGALDPIVRSELQADLYDIFTKLERTVVLVTHDLAEAEFLGKTMVLMSAGRVMQQGTLAELEKNPADPFVERFVQAQRHPGRSTHKTRSDLDTAAE